MPLSDREQSILRQIEQDLNQDGTFTERVHHVSRRRVVMLAAALVIGLLATIAGLIISSWVAFVAFVAVFVVAVLLEAEVRLVGRDTIGALATSVRSTRSARPRRRPG